MLDAFQSAYAFTSRPDIEGGVVNDPNDPGGLTNTGLTMPDLRRFARDATPNDLTSLTDAEKQALYLALYWLPLAGWQLPPPVALMTFDHGVNCGIGTSAKLLQHILMVDEDGQIGRDTLAAMAAVPTRSLGPLLTALYDAQDLDYRGKANAPRYIKGWENRLVKRLAAARALGVTSGTVVGGAAS